MNNQTTFERIFLLENLPKGINRADEHLQMFDNFIEKTRCCLRKTRNPKINEYSYILGQKFPLEENDLSVWSVSEIILNQPEYEVFANKHRAENELRFNRYFYNYQSKKVKIDVYLGKLKGLVLGKISFSTFAEMQDFEMPVFAKAEVTQNKLFIGENLSGKTFAQVQE